MEKYYKISVFVWNNDVLNERPVKMELLSKQEKPSYRYLRDLISETLDLEPKQIHIEDPNRYDLQELYDWSYQQENVIENLEKIKIIITHDLPAPKIIGLTGATRSGKGTLAGYLKISLNAEVLNLDCFYKSEEFINDQLKGNWDVPESYDWEKLHVGVGEIIEKCRRNRKPYLILDSFLLFESKQLFDMCDVRLFLDIKNEEIRERRKGYVETYENYVENTIFPEYKRYKEMVQQKYVKQCGDSCVHFLSGSQPKIELFKLAKKLILK